MTVYTQKFLEGLSGKLAERWFASVFTPAFVFWAGGAIAAIQKFGWEHLRDAIGLTNMAEPGQIALLIVALLVIVTSAFVIERFDFATLRLLEGYWPNWCHPLRRWCISRQRQHRQDADRHWQQLFAQQTAQPLSPEEADTLAQIDTTLRQFPPVNKLMPTRLGNQLRAAELRPYSKYGLDSVRCWPYLWLLLPAQIRGDLAETRNDLNTAARTWFWSLLFLTWGLWAWWAIPLGLLSAYFAYGWALDAAGAYGVLLEAAFDLHRFDLYRALHLPLPASPTAEKALASHVNTYLARGYFPDGFQYDAID